MVSQIYDLSRFIIFSSQIESLIARIDRILKLEQKLTIENPDQLDRAERAECAAFV